MEKIDRLLTFLSYARRVVKQLCDLRNLKYCYLIFKGFLPDRGYFFNFRKFGYQSYVSDSTRYLKSVFINYNNRDLLSDKYGCTLFLNQFTDKTVPVYGLIDNAQFYYLQRERKLVELLAAENKFILKPRKGRGGQGVKVLEVRDGRFFLSGEELPNFSSAFLGLENYVFCPYLTQHEYASRIYSVSVNTIRLLTCVFDDQAKVMAAGHRFGSEGTCRVDNFSQGGIFAQIDVQSGILGFPMMWDPKAYKMVQVDHHPATGQPIAGINIPHWRSMVEEMLELHAHLKFIRYVGWDLVVTPDSFRIIEANYASDLIGLQLQTPLLLNKENRCFFQRFAR